MLLWIDADLGRDLALQIHGHILSTISRRFLIVAEDIPALLRSHEHWSAQPGLHDGWTTFLRKQPDVARELRHGLGYVHAVIGFGVRHGSVHDLLESVLAMHYPVADTAFRFVAVENGGGGRDVDEGSKTDSKETLPRQWPQTFSEVGRQFCHCLCTQLHIIEPDQCQKENFMRMFIPTSSWLHYR